MFWDLSSPAAAAAAKSLQSCPALCDPIDGSPAGSTHREQGACTQGREHTQSREHTQRSGSKEFYSF